MSAHFINVITTVKKRNYDGLDMWSDQVASAKDLATERHSARAKGKTRENTGGQHQRGDWPETSTAVRAAEDRQR